MKKTQGQKIIDFLKTGNKLTTYSACVKKLTTKLPTRIGELTKLGFKFTIEKVGKTGIAKHNSYGLDFKRTNKKLLS